ncbi:MAG: class I SAM-dependent methyltransferase [Gammaproteobacteria bacterium]|nr:class I SAM-dependent methyltransferase [Gammaproteobacteria bacterium]
MELIEKATIIHYHRHRIKAFNAGTVESLGWKGDESQQKRFEVISEVADLNGASILDLGCGQGDLKKFLDNRYSDFSYIGIDQMPEFISEAELRYGHLSDTHFYQSDFSTVVLPQVEYVIACGALGYRCAKPNWFNEMIAKMYASASRALVFNMLDIATFPDHPLLVGHEVEEVAAFCKTLSPRVEVKSRYLDDDFTIYMYRDTFAGSRPEAHQDDE